MQIRFEDSQRQIKALAHRVLRRAHRAGARTVQLEDIVSELSIAWCIARKKFDPSVGIPFGAYLHRGMLQHINHWIQKQIDETHGVSLDAQPGYQESYLSRPLSEIISDKHAASPEEAAEATSKRRLVERNLTGNTELFVRVLESGHPELQDALVAARERSEFAKSRGLKPSPVPKSVTPAMIFDLMGLGRHDRHEVRSDLTYWTGTTINYD